MSHGITPIPGIGICSRTMRFYTRKQWIEFTKMVLVIVLLFLGILILNQCAGLMFGA